jgi:hypothetical protein
VGLVLYGLRHETVESALLTVGPPDGDSLVTKIAGRMRSWFDEL